MRGHRARVSVSRAVTWRVGLLALSGGLVAIGLWLDQQFDASRGPVRGVSPEIVVWISLAAVGLVLTLWVAAEITADRKPAVRGARGGRS